MKKLYSLSLLLVMLFGFSFNAGAYNLKFEWDTPGAVVVKEGSYGDSGTVVFDGKTNPTATSYEYTGSNPQLYVLPADGFYIIEGECVALDRTFKPASYLGNGFSLWVTDNMYNQTISIKCGKIERNDTFTFDVVNGADYFTAEFSNGIKLDLKNGKNVINFNPDIDQKLYIRFSNRDYMYMYSLQYNGTEMVEAGTKFDYTFNTIAPNSTITLQWFEEGKEPQLKDCTVSFEIKDNVDAAIISIFDKSSSTMWTLDKLPSKQITVKEGSTVTVNLNNKDYDYFFARYNGYMIQPEENDKGEAENYTLTVTAETNTFYLQCQVREYEPVPFTAYIQNPQGVDIFVSTEESTPLTLSGGTSIPNNLTKSAGALDSDATETFTFDKATTKMFNLQADGKHPLLLIRAKAGYYIETFIGSQDNEGKTAWVQCSGGLHLAYAPDKTVYIMALPVGTNTAKMDVKLEGGQPSDYVLLPYERATSWGNPTCDTKLTAAENTITFEAGLDNPFIIRGNGITLNAVYVDAVEVAQIVSDGVETGKYEVKPYIPTSADDPGYSTVVAFSGSNTPVTSGVTFELLDGAKADFYATTARRKASVGENPILSGTTFYVKPADPKAVITYKNDVVNGYDPVTKTTINGLDERGEYAFLVTGNARNNILTVGPAVEAPNYTPIEIASVEPAAGTTVRSLKDFHLTLPNPGKELNGSWEALEGICIKQGDEIVTTIDLDIFPEMGMTEGDVDYYIDFSMKDRVTADGKYTLYVPQGLFAEMVWDNAAGTMVAISGGYASELFTAEYTVDSNLPTAFDEYTLNPADGATLGELSDISITFPALSNLDMILANQSGETPEPTITDGTDTYTCLVSYDWDVLEGRALLIQPTDAQGSLITLGKGEWTLTIPAKAFSYKGEENAEIKATYSVAGKLEYLGIDPAEGSELRSIESFALTLPQLPEMGETMLYPNEKLVNAISFTDKDGNNAGIGVAMGEMSEDLDGNFVQEFILSAPLATEGEWTLNIPADLYQQSAWIEESDASEGGFEAVVNGYKTAAWTVNYTINPSAPNSFTNYALDPADGSKLESLSTITLAFEDIEVPAPILNGDEEATITNGTETYTCDIVETEGDCLTYEITFLNDKMGLVDLTDGEWTLTIPAGYFRLGKEASDEITATYTVDSNMGISSIEADAEGNYTVVGIDGRVLLRSNDAEALKTLDKGIYIVNGHKVAIKK